MKYPDNCTKDPEYNDKNEDRVISRMATVEFIFKSIQEKGHFQNAYLNRALLLTAIESYYIDIARAKCFHDIQLADSHKKASFSIKWLIKFRPIQLGNTCDNGSIKNKDVLVNEIFALFIGLNLLEIDFNDLQNLSTKYLNNLFYTLRFREIEPMMFSSVMYLLQKGLKQQVP